jgi:hydroxymethylbilane synthase
MSRVRIATRSSDLALWQARHVASCIEAKLGARTELVPLKTTGDRLQGSLAKVGGKGLFVKEIEEALLEGRADVAVHSAKDLPALAPEALAFVAFPERADARDALVSRNADASLANLPAGARVGTGSVRRTAQLRRLRQDLEIVPLRGNVPTRLRKLDEDDLDAIVLACAGLDRLELAASIVERIGVDALLPAVAQGALAIQARAGEALAGDLAVLDHTETHTRVAAERAFQARLGADCNVPVAAHAELEADGVWLRGLVIAPDGTAVASGEVRVARSEARKAGEALAARLLDEGGDAILARAREAGA